MTNSYEKYLSLFVLILSFGQINAQFLVEVLEQTNFGTQRPVFRCEATGANFGQDVLAFSFTSKAIGCAIISSPKNACEPVHFPEFNHTCDSHNYFAVVPRGNCTFSEKAHFVQNAKPNGFSALIVYNYPEMDPVAMSGSNYSSEVNIPLVMISYVCMSNILGQYSAEHGYVITLKASPGYYDLIKYLVPFVVIVGFCFIVLFISLIIRLYRERRRLARKRLSRSQLKKIPIQNYRKGEDQDRCAICLEDFIEDERLRVLPCRHGYHSKCIDPWLTKNRKVCPVCKRKVGPSNGSDSDTDNEHQTSTTSVTTHEGDPLIRATTSGSSSQNSSSQSARRLNIFNFRWFTRLQPNVDMASTSGLSSSSQIEANTEILSQDESQSLIRRFSRAVDRTFLLLKRRITDDNSNPHSRLVNEDSLSTSINDGNNNAQPTTDENNGLNNSVFEGGSLHDGSSLTTVYSNQYVVQADVEHVPPNTS